MRTASKNSSDIQFQYRIRPSRASHVSSWNPNGPARLVILAGLLGSLALLTGCHSLKITEPTRSVTEQLLLSTAADRAAQQADMSSLTNKKVYIDEKYLESYDRAYVAGTVREYAAKSGAQLVDEKSKAEIVVEIRSGGLGLDMRESLLGIPDLTVPIPLAGPVTTPELALYKSTKADSLAKFALFAYDREAGTYIHSTGPMDGTARFHHYKFLGFFDWRVTDIPQLEVDFKGKREPKFREVSP